MGRFTRLAASPLALCVAAGLLAAQGAVARDPQASVQDVLGLAVRVTLGCWALATAWLVTRAVLRGQDVDRDAWQVRPVAGLAWSTIALAGAVLIGASLMRAPSRLLVNLLGYCLVLGPALWLVRRRSGPVAASAAAAVVAIFAFLPGAVQRQAPPPVALSADDSREIWSAGWPLHGWVLRQELEVPPALVGRPVLLWIPLAHWYTGPGRVRVTVNGRDVEQARLEETRIYVPLPPPDAATRMVVELRAEGHDPSLRVLAYRWLASVSAKPAPSSYFDGEQWRPGTFNDVAAAPRGGAYLVMLMERE